MHIVVWEHSAVWAYLLYKTYSYTFNTRADIVMDTIYLNSLNSIQDIMLII